MVLNPSLEFCLKPVDTWGEVFEQILKRTSRLFFIPNNMSNGFRREDGFMVSLYK